MSSFILCGDFISQDKNKNTFLLVDAILGNKSGEKILCQVLTSFRFCFTHLFSLTYLSLASQIMPQRILFCINMKTVHEFVVNRSNLICWPLCRIN